jgi:hypothetical protein
MPLIAEAVNQVNWIEEVMSASNTNAGFAFEMGYSQ